MRSNALRHNLTPAETRIWQVLRSHHLEGVHFRRQHAIGPYIVDFCASEKKLVIEVDGGQHLDVEDYDQQRTAYLEAIGYVVLRFWNNGVMDNLDAVLAVILDRLGSGGDNIWDGRNMVARAVRMHGPEPPPAPTGALTQSPKLKEHELGGGILAEVRTL